MKKTNKMNKAVIIISKIMEVCNFVASILFLVMSIFVASGKDFIISKLSNINSSMTTELHSNGFEIMSADGSVLTNGSYLVFFITMIFVSLCMMMIFRNIYLIFKTAEGKTWFAKGETPFQPDVIRMVREIGIFAIIIPIVQLIASAIARVVIGTEVIECAVEFDYVIFGFIVICLSKYFSYGMKLEEDVKGLV